MRWEAALFAESQSRIVLSTAPEHVETVRATADRYGVPCRVVGRTGGPRLTIAIEGEAVLDVDLETAARAWSGGLEAALGAPSCP